MKRIRFFCAAALTLILLLAAFGGNDAPPDDGTPPPSPLEGTFTSEYGTMTFDGDGKSVTLDLNEGLATLSGLPSGKSEVSYVFLFHNEEWRYDKAEYFRVMLDGESFQFRNALGETDENAVSFYLDNGGTAIFRKE